MRHAAALAVSLLVFTAACGDSKNSAAPTTSTTVAPGATTTAPGATTAPTSTVAGLPKPTVSVPATLPTALVVTDLTKGTGPAAAKGDLLVVHYIGVRSADGKEFDNSYDRGQPLEVPLGAGRVIPGWDNGLVGVQAGGRRQLDIPAALAYGDSPPDTAVIQKGDALSFVIDVVALFPGSKASDQPKVTIAKVANSPTPVNTELITGTGITPKDGQHVAVRISLYRADDATQLTTTWGSPPVVFGLGSASTTYPGFATAVEGMKVGGRRLAQIPFATVFDGKGNATLKVPASVDLIAVIDLVGYY